MATYFDSGESVDLALLHPDVQTHSDLDRVIDEVEQDIVAQLTKEGGSALAAPSGSTQGVCEYTENGRTFTVWLYGYKQTLADAAGYSATRAAWTGLAKAMRDTIALVVSHRLKNYDAQDGVSQETHGRESWSYRAGRDSAWPSGWDRSLRKYIPHGYDPRTVWT